MAIIRLDEVEMYDRLAVLAQGSRDPAFRGSNPDGDTYLCGACGEQVVAEHVDHGDLYDLAFLCYSCSGLSISPRLPAGRPLPLQTTVVVPPGHYLIQSTVFGRKGVVMAGREAVDRALLEIGAASFGAGAPSELDADFLESLVARAGELLGNSYDSARASFERGRRSHTPPKIPHRLMELVAAAETAAESFRLGRPTIDPVSIVELHTFVSQLERWSRHPLWSNLVRSLANPQDFPHLLLTFAAASLLSDAGNNAELVAVADSRTPDLKIHVTGRNVVSTELKSPLALQHPAPPIDPQIGRVVIEKALKSAKAQLSAANHAILIVGGLSLRESDLDALQTAAADVFALYRQRRAQVLAIVILSLGVLLDSREVGLGQTLPQLSGIILARYVRNDYYAGDIALKPDQQSGLSVEGQLEELQLGALEEIEISSVPAGGV